MSAQAQLFIAMAVIGIIIGGIATLSVKGRGLVPYVVAGLLGSFIGGHFLAFMLTLVLSEGRFDPFIVRMIGSIFGAAVLVVLGRSVFKLR